MINRLKKYLKIGQILEVTLETEKISGKLIELDDIGIVLKTSRGSRFIKATKIDDFEAIEEANCIANDEENINCTAIDDLTLDVIDIDIESTNKDIMASNNFDKLEEDRSDYKERFELAFEKFDSINEITLPAIDFSLLKNEISREDFQEINKFKNQYEYAVKVKELSRIVSMIHNLIPLADRIKNHDLYLICGLLALEIKDTEQAKKYLSNALAKNSWKACIALIKIAIEKQQWEEAAKFVIEIFMKKEGNNIDEKNLLLVLGHCIKHLDDKELKGLAGIPVADENKKIFYQVLAMALIDKSYEMAKLVYDGNIGKASHLGLESPIFTPPSDLANKYTIKLVSNTITNEKSLINNSVLFGHISSVYPEKQFGYIISNEQESFFFHFNQVADPNLLGILRRNKTGQKVSFKRRKIDAKNKPSYIAYDHADNIQCIEVIDKSFIIPAMPKGNSNYANAKFAEQSGDLSKAEKLYLIKKIVGKVLLKTWRHFSIVEKKEAWKQSLFLINIEKILMIKIQLII